MKFTVSLWPPNVTLQGETTEDEYSVEVTFPPGETTQIEQQLLGMVVILTLEVTVLRAHAEQMFAPAPEVIAARAEERLAHHFPGRDIRIRIRRS